VSLKLQENFFYSGWPNCLRLFNSEIELVIATDIGLRILHFGFIGGKNLFYLSPEELGKTSGDSWRNYGGHRLTHAPETLPATYCPDNEPVRFHFDSQTLKITQAREVYTGLVKEMEIVLSADQNQVRVLHRIINKNLKPVFLSAWAISCLESGGGAIVPQEPYGAGNDFLLPARSLALWSYTNMQDPGWIWGRKYIQAKPDKSAGAEQKIGVLNKPGWMAYSLGEDILLKFFPFDPAAEYPDYGCNSEIYFNNRFLELETLGPLVELLPEGETEHIEYWLLSKGNVGHTEESIDQELLQKVRTFRNRVIIPAHDTADRP
jgi:hypothetical protein